MLPDTKRIFIGIPVDPESQALIDDLLKPLKHLHPDVNWVRRSNRHLTLAFLGDTAVADVQNLLRVFEQTFQGQTHFQCQLTRLSRFPALTGRIVALTGAPDSALLELAGITRAVLDKLGIEFDRKTFRPHITLARIRKRTQLETPIDQTAKINLMVDEIIVYETIPGEFGSIYTPIKATSLA